MRFVGSNAFSHIASTRGGQTCSMDDSFAENQKHQQAAKPLCSGLNDVQ